MIDYVGLLWFRDTRGAGENAVVAVRDCHCRPPPCHLCNAFTSTNTLAILGVADVGTGDGLDHLVAAVLAIVSRGRPPL